MQIEEEIEEVTEYLNEDNKSNCVVDNISTPTLSSGSTKKKVITTKTSKPTTFLSTPYPGVNFINVLRAPFCKYIYADLTGAQRRAYSIKVGRNF